MNRETLTQMRQWLVKLYDDPQTIRLLAEDAGLMVARINMGGSAVNIWHAVLNEAQKVGRVNALVSAVLADYPEQEETARGLLGSDFVPETQPAQTNVPTNTTTNTTTTPPVTPTVATPAPRPQPAAPTLSIDHPRGLRLHQDERALLSTLFRQAARLRILTEFTDGRTATRVFLIRPTDTDGVEELPAVVKIGPQALIEPEWQATQRHVLRRLPGLVAIQADPVYLALPDGTLVGALRYGQVGEGIYPIQSLAAYLAEATTGDSWHVLEKRLFLQLGQLWHATISWAPLLVQNSYDHILPVNFTATAADPTAADPTAARGGLPALALDGRALAGATAPLPVLQTGDWVQLLNFSVSEVVLDGQTPPRAEITLDLPPQPNATRTAYRVRVIQPTATPPTVGTLYPPTLAQVTTTRQALLQQQAAAQLDATLDLTQPELPLPGTPGQQLPNPLLALPALLTRGHDAKFATIHGDLNLRNILVDTEARTTHIIDCAAARQDHAIHDLLRMERDYLTDVLAKFCFQAHLPPTTIVRLYQFVHCATRGAAAASGHFSLPADLPPRLHKPFVLLVTLRQAARELLATPGQWDEYYTGLIIHLLGALKFRDLDNATAGQQPKALAFWGAATLWQLLRAGAAGEDRTCRGIEWRFFDLTKAGEAATKGLTPPDEAETRGFSPDETGGLESYTPSATTPPTADLPPAQRRLDVAAPEKATLGRAFSLAVAVRQRTSPTLAIAELPAVRSGQALLDWPAAERFVRLRAEIIAPDCEIVGTASYTFKLYRDLDSEVYHFSLIPKATGQLSIIVRLYQEADMLGSALAYTTVGEAVVSEVPVQLRSEPVTLNEEPEQAVHHATAPSADRPIKILFLAANPLDTVRLRTDDEARAIDQALRQAEQRNFEIRVHGAVRVDDLQELLLRHNPDIVHFSGHGANEQALLLQGPNGNAVQVSGTALRQLFGVLRGNIRCIVLNACYTAAQAQALAEVVDCVVGIEDAISDEAARQFSTAFYRALGYAKSIGDAFALGQVQIELAGLGEGAALHLLTREDGAAAFRFGGTPAVATPATTPTQHRPTPAVDPEFLQSLLTQHRRNLQLLQRQKANYGAGEEPLRLLNQIAAEEEEIARIEGALGAK